MNFYQSPFWGGVLAVTFYQLIFTNPVSFLSLILGTVIGFGLSLYAISQLLVRGYINMAERAVEILVTTFRDYPILRTIFGNYLNNIFDVLHPKPVFPVVGGPTNSPVCRPQTSQSPFNMSDINNMGDIMNIFKNLNVHNMGDLVKNLNLDLSDIPVENQEDVPVAAQAAAPVENQDVPVVAQAVEPVVIQLPVPDELPESCRGVHGVNTNDPIEDVPIEDPISNVTSPRRSPSSPRRKGIRSRSIADKPKPVGWREQL